MREPRRRVSVPEYNRMLDAGILTAEDHVELIDGEILAVSPMGERHAAVVTRLTRHLTVLLFDHAIVRSQLPIVLGEWSEPEPDCAVVRLRDDFYSGEHPTSEDIFFLIEVSDSTVAFDREVKARLYAAHGIQETWIVDLQSDTLSIHRDPSNHGYSRIEDLKAGASVSPLAFMKHTCRVNDFIPSR